MKNRLLASTILLSVAAVSQAAEIPAGLSWLPSDPLNISLDGNQTYDLWLNLASSSNSSRTTPFYFNGNLMGYSPYIVPGNSGYGMFPGTNPATWATPIRSQFWTNGHTQGELHKISNGTGGGPFPSGSTIYYGGASPVANTDGGTLGVKSYAISDIQTVAFQLSLGEAYGYTLYDRDGNGFGFEDMPKLNVYDTSGGFLTTLSADYADIIKKAYNGSLDMPPGSGVDEDIYINTFGLQWDLSALAGEVGSFQIDWTGVQHAQLWSFRVDQTDAAYDSFIFDVTSTWTGAGDGVWGTAANWSGNILPQDVGRAVFGTGDGVELTANTTVSQITISSAEDFTISSANGSTLTAGLNIITQRNGGPTDHTVSADVFLPTTVTMDVGENTSLTLSGDLSGTGIYKRGAGDLTLSGTNEFSGNLVFADGTTIVSGTNTTSAGSLLDIKNARVILQGDNRFTDQFSVKMAGTSTHGQAAYLQLGDGTTEGITQTLSQLNAVKPQYVQDLNPLPQTDPPAYVVGGNSKISTLIVNGGVYSGYLGGSGQYENNLSLVVGGNLTLQGVSTYVGDTVINSTGVLRINQQEALSANSNLVINGGMLALGGYTYKINDGANGPGTDVTKSVDTFTRSLGGGAGEVRFTGSGGFSAVGGDKVVNLGGDGRQIAWTNQYFVGEGNRLILSSESSNRITFANAIDLGSASRTIEVGPNSTAEVSGVLSGSGGITKSGNGSLFLSGLNTYTGVTRIEAGQLRLSQIGNAGGPSILGNTSNAASNLVIAGGQLNYVGSASSSTDRLFTIAAASGTIANDGTGTVHFTNTGAVAYDHAGVVEFQLRGTNNTANRFDSLITNNGANAVSVRKGGASNADSGGYWILGNESNSYTGSTFINSGILEVTKFSNGGQVSSIGASTSAAANLKFFRGGIKYTGDGDSTDRLFSISGYGATYSANSIDSSGTGALKFTNTGFIGLTTSAGGATAVIGTGGHLALTGSNKDDNTIASAIGGSGTFTSATAYTTGSRVTKDGVGTWILSGKNTYAGVTEVLGGTLGVTSLGNGGVIVLFNTTSGSATATVTSAAGLVVGQSIEGLGIAPGTTIASISGTTITLSQAATATYTSGNNRYKLVGSANGIGLSTNAATNLVINGGTLQYLGAGDSTDRRFTLGANGGGLDSSGIGAVNFTNTGAVTHATLNTARTLELTGTNAGNNTLAAPIGNAGTGVTSLTKNGTGRWVLTGANTYTGATRVNEGTLALGAAGSFSASTVIQVAEGARLDVSAVANFTVGAQQTVTGGGSIAGNVTFAGTLSPGNSPGTFTFENSLALTATSVIDWEIQEIGGVVDHDLVEVGSTLTIANGATLNLIADGIDFSSEYWSLDRSFTVISAGSLGGDYSTTNPLVLDNHLAGLGYGTWTVGYGPTGVALNWAAVPEPSTMLLGGLGALYLLHRRRVS